MTNKPLRFGPQYVPGSAGNILEPPTATGGVLNGGTFASGQYANLYILLTHIHITNTTGSAVTLSLYVGGSSGSAGGTEIYPGVSIPANGTLDWVGRMPIYPGEFLTGVAGSASALTITGEGEIGVA